MGSNAPHLASSPGVQEEPEASESGEATAEEGGSNRSSRRRGGPPPGPDPGPGDGGGGRRTPSRAPTSTPSSTSTVGTSELRSLLRRRRDRPSERPKSSIGSVKIEEFLGDRRRFPKWRKAVVAQERLYKLDPAELSMLIYLSTKGEARDILDQRQLSEYTSEDGLHLLWRLLDGESTAEHFERAERELSGYRRIPGQTVASYVATMERLKAQYIITDPETVISDRSWAQRLLNRALLNRRERLDVFYSAGGAYVSDAIEKALRHRSAHLHEEEETGSMRSTAASSSPTRARSRMTTSSRTSTSRSGVHLADGAQDAEMDEEEDLEAEASVDDEGPEFDEMAIPEEEVASDEEDDDASMASELKEAFTAGWRAKGKTNAVRKARGWSRPNSSSSGTSPTSPVSLKDRKKLSTCASCGAKGHWKGDPECVNVQRGKDKPHQPKGKSDTIYETNEVHFTYMVGPVEETLAPCPECKKVNPQDAKFCCGCGHKLKRGWTVVGGGTAPSRTIDSESDASVPQGPRRMYDKSRGSQAERTKTEQALDKLSKAEKKALKKALQEDDEDSAWRALENNRPYRASSGYLPRPEASHASGSDQLPVAPKAQMPLPPRDLLRPPSREDEEGRDKAKGVRQREMSEFKQALYDHSYNGRRCVPSTASPIPTELQATCPHRLEDLLWTSNEHGHYARCKRCDLKNVLYYSQRHGVLVYTCAPFGKGNPEGIKLFDYINEHGDAGGDC